MEQREDLRTPATRRGLIGWALYDWANSPFTTLIITFVFAAYFSRGIVGDEVQGQALWGYVAGISAVFVAILSPVLGAVADAGGASGASGSGEKEFLTGPPPSQPSGASGAAGASVPSVTLSEINRLIGQYADLLSAGRDIPGYEFCLQQGFREEAYARAGHFRSSTHEREILSGLPEGTRLWPEPDE